MHVAVVGAVVCLVGSCFVMVTPVRNDVDGARRINFAMGVLSRHVSTGEITYVEMHKDGVGGVNGLDGASSVTVNPDGNHVYVAGTIDAAVVVFSRNASTGANTDLEMHNDGVGGVEGLGGASSVT